MTVLAFPTAPPPRWVGVVGRPRVLSGAHPVTMLRVIGRRADLTRLFPSLRDQLPWFQPLPDGRVADLRDQPTIYGLRL